MFKKNNRIVCTNKSLKFEISELNPLKWLIDPDFNSNFMVFEVDGYIIEKNKKPNGIFSRLELEAKNLDDIDLNFLCDFLIKNYFDKIYYNVLFSDFLNIGHWLIITVNNYPLGYKHEDKGIISINFKIDNNDKLLINTIKQLNVFEMEKGIKMLRKFSFDKVKPLSSSPSHLSCHLNNNTLNPFPGDIDAVIFDKKNKTFRSFIEFKTHNINSPTENESIDKYGDQDWRRFEVLFDLQEYIRKEKKIECNLFYIAWGTKDFENHKNIKIDRITRKKIINTKIIERPEFGVFSKLLLESLI